MTDPEIPNDEPSEEASPAAEEPTPIVDAAPVAGSFPEPAEPIVFMPAAADDALLAAPDEPELPLDELMAENDADAEAVQGLTRAVEELSDRFDRRMDQLQTLIDREIRAEATREKVVDRLHAELQEYKQDLLLNTMRPVFIDLIQLHDDIGKVAVAPADADLGADALRLLGLMQGFQQGIEDILYRQGVEPFQVEDEAFDPRRQRAVGTVPTEDVEQNKKVAARLRKGFRAGDRVIRPEIVSVFAVKK